MDNQMLVDVVTLSTHLAIIEYAIVHIEDRFISGDTKNLRAAAKQCRTIIDKWLEAVPKEKGE